MHTARLFFRTPFAPAYRLLYLFGMMILFLALFDGSFSYLVPIVITDSGYSKTFMGFIYASSSVFGAILDIFLSKFLRNTHFRRVYLVMFLLCALCPALLIKTFSVWFYLAAMAFWGFYYDLSNFGVLDFVSRKFAKEDHSARFGIILIFKQLGYTIAPLVMGALLVGAVTLAPYFVTYFLLGATFLFFLLLLLFLKKSSVDHIEENIDHHRRSALPELPLIKNIGRLLYPVLILTCFLWIYDAFFWTIGPLMQDTFGTLSGIFLTLYTLPILVIGFFIGKVNHRLGKKRTAQIACLIASLLLCTFFVVTSPLLILIVEFLASCFIAFCIPSLNGAYADYISESPQYEKEIESLQDFSTNIGYIVGPLVGGFLADRFGNLHSFGYLGMLGVAVSLLLLVITPRHIMITAQK